MAEAALYWIVFLLSSASAIMFGLAIFLSKGWLRHCEFPCPAENLSAQEKESALSHAGDAILLKLTRMR